MLYKWCIGCKDDVYCKNNKHYKYDVYYKGFWTIRKNKNYIDDVCCKKHCCQGHYCYKMLIEMFQLEDVATQGVSAKGSCYQRMINANIKMLLPKDINVNPRCCCTRSCCQIKTLLPKVLL